MLSFFKSEAGHFWLIEALLCLVAGGLFLWTADTQLADTHGLSQWNTAVFKDYCAGLLHMGGEDVAWPNKRSQFAGLLPMFFKGSHGVLGALRMGALIGTFLVGAGLYAWGRVLSGRTAGFLTVAFALSCAPMTRLPRMLTHYPESTACFVIAAAMVSAGLIHRQRRGLAWVGAGIGIALCADVRGLVWAVPWAIAALVVLWKFTANRKQAAKAFFIPIVIAFFVGRWAYPANTASFESQLDVRPLYHDRFGSEMEEHQPPYDEGGAFVWGRSGPWRLPQTGFFILNQLTIEPPPNFPPDVSGFSQDNHLKPLQKMWWLGAALAIVALRKRRETLAILMVSVVPFAVGFIAQHGMAEIFARFLAQLLPGVAVLLGVGLGQLIDDLPGPGQHGTRWAPVRTLVAFGITMQIVLGNLHTPLSPHANWRRPWPAMDIELSRVDPRLPGPDLEPKEKACLNALKNEKNLQNWMPRNKRLNRSRPLVRPKN